MTTYRNATTLAILILSSLVVWLGIRVSVDRRYIFERFDRQDFSDAYRYFSEAAHTKAYADYWDQKQPPDGGKNWHSESDSWLVKYARTASEYRSRNGEAPLTLEQQESLVQYWNSVANKTRGDQTTGL